MASASKTRVPKFAGSWDDEQNEVDDYMENAGVAVPPIAELLKTVQKVEEIKLPDDALDDSAPKDSDKTGDEELDQLLAEIAERPPSQHSKGKGVKFEKPLLELKTQPDDDDDYEESYASQQETAQLREDLDSMREKLNTLSGQFNLVMKERENLPETINNIRADLNTQLTLFNDKLSIVLESRASEKEIKAAMATVEEIRADHSDQLKAAASYLSSDPKPGSPLVNKGVSLKGKGKFKPVK